MSPEDNPRLITVTWPVDVPPICLQYALGTRVCAVRVDSAEVLYKTVSSRNVCVCGSGGVGWVGVGNWCRSICDPW